MAAKDSNDKSKTSKTARVMNLLSKKHDPALSPEEAQADESTPEVQASQPTPPMLTSINADAAVSSQIKSALEEALEDELAPNPPAAQESPAAPAAPASPPPPQPVPPAKETTIQSAPQPPFVSAPLEQATGYINVMQVLVEEKAPKYVKLFGLCDCERCLADVKALTLNHLPPKYVVMDQGDMIPKLTFYEGKYSSDITAQLLQACKVVMNTPHHNR